MGISQMLMKLAEGMATSCWIFGITLLFSLPLGMVIAFGRMSKKRIVQAAYHQDLYFHHARDAADVTASGGLFRTVLSFRDQNFTVLPKHCGGDRFCA